MIYNKTPRNGGRSVDLTPQKRHPKDKRPPSFMPFDIALRKFRKNVESAGIIKELRAREFYEKPTSKRKRKKAEAVKRHQKKLSSELNTFNARGRRNKII
jgi:small subunit ribosomal protein S21|tara:strand:+ start:119 stop:418 length:300 start_codon:yes stop_codon:yes gene_type:complete